MAQVPFSKLNASSLRDAVRKSIQEQRDAEQPKVDRAEAQIESARSRGLTIVTHMRTGRKGWLVHESVPSTRYRVRWAGVTGKGWITMERPEDIVELDA